MMQTDSYDFISDFITFFWLSLYWVLCFAGWLLLGTLLCCLIVIGYFTSLEGIQLWWRIFIGYSALLEDFYWVLRFAGGLDTRLFLELKIFKLIIGAIEHQYLKLWFDMRTKYWQYSLFIYLNYILHDDIIDLVLALSLHIPQLYTPRLKNRSSIGSIISTYTSIIYSKVIE